MWQHVIVSVIVALSAWHLLTTFLGMFRSSGEKCGGCAKECSSEPDLVSIQGLDEDTN